jgi:uncharacterized membrane protein
MREPRHVQRLVTVLNSYGAWIVAAAFSVSGVIHLFDPKEFTPLAPQFLPFSIELVYASGVAELICAYGLWRRQRWAGIGAAALLLAIWPANLQAAVTAQSGENVSNQMISWIRFPLQIPLIWLALRSGRSTAAYHDQRYQSAFLNEGGAEHFRTTLLRRPWPSVDDSLGPTCPTRAAAIYEAAAPGDKPCPSRADREESCALGAMSWADVASRSALEKVPPEISVEEDEWRAKTQSVPRTFHIKVIIDSSDGSEKYTRPIRPLGLPSSWPQRFIS